VEAVKWASAVPHSWSCVEPLLYRITADHTASRNMGSILVGFVFIMRPSGLRSFELVSVQSLYYISGPGPGHDSASNRYAISVA
jgi:hypothetical protein